MRFNFWTVVAFQCPFPGKKTLLCACKLAGAQSAAKGTAQNQKRLQFAEAHVSFVATQGQLATSRGSDGENTERAAQTADARSLGRGGRRNVALHQEPRNLKGLPPNKGSAFNCALTASEILRPPHARRVRRSLVEPFVVHKFPNAAHPSVAPGSRGGLLLEAVPASHQRVQIGLDSHPA